MTRIRRFVSHSPSFRVKLLGLVLALGFVPPALCAQTTGGPVAPTGDPSDPQGSEKSRGPLSPQGKPPRVLVTATRESADGIPEFDAPASTSTVTADDLRERALRTVPEALRDVPGVMVQKTAHGHGSPYIRGFTSFRTLFLIDGIRLNNSVFRPGPNQYWNTVDSSSLDRIEVVKGPSSVLYGSDAIGGTVSAVTKSPLGTGGAVEPGLDWSASTFLRYSTAENSVVGRGEVRGRWGHDDGSATGVLIGGNVKRFGDLEGGKEIGTQPMTGYDEDNFDVKIQHRFDQHTTLSLLHQRVVQDDVPRTHRTIFAKPFRGSSTGSDQQRSFDQNRELTYAQLRSVDLDGPINALQANLSWQRQTEIRDRIRGNGNQEFTGFEVDTIGAYLQLESYATPVGDLRYGVEWYRDEVDSFFRRVQNPRAADAIQGPVADDATYDLLAVYVEDLFRPIEHSEVRVGVRYQYAAADANSVRDPDTDLRIGLEDSWDALVFSGSARYELEPDQWAVFGRVSQGFRAPNLSDLSRFDSARSGEFEIPATNLDAEDYVSFELGSKVEAEDWSLQAAYFYTLIEDQILRFPTGNVRSGEAEITKGNIGDGHIYGVELGSAWRPAEAFTVFGNLTFLEGRLSNFSGPGTSREDTFPTRLMPLTMQVGVRYDDPLDRFFAETRVLHAEAADKLSFGDQRDASRIPPGGTPGYTVWHSYGGYHFDDRTTLLLALENITDADYRIHGSGLNMAGRNLIISLETRF